MTQKQWLIIGALVIVSTFCLFMGLREKHKANAVDKPFVWSEASNWSIANLDSMIVRAMQDNPDCKWAEARGKKNDPETLEIVCHTTAKSP